GNFAHGASVGVKRKQLPFHLALTHIRDHFSMRRYALYRAFQDPVILKSERRQVAARALENFAPSYQSIQTFHSFESTVSKVWQSLKNPLQTFDSSLLNPGNFLLLLLSWVVSILLLY